MTKRRIHTEPRRYWTKAEDRIVRKHYPHMPTADVVKMLPGRKLCSVYQRAYRFGLEKTAAYLASPAAHRLDGVKGTGSRFPKGHVPANKGLRRPGWGPGRMKLTQFKNGGRSKRWPIEDYQIGALRVNSDGQLDIKAREGMRAWDCMARYVWRTERGPIPPAHVIRYRNGDQHDTRIENLELITRAEHLRRNWHDRYPLSVKQMTQLRGALQRQINKREGKREPHNQRPA